MPDREKSESQPTPPDRKKQGSSLLRAAVVVGLPLLSVLLRLPIWFTLLLMLGLAVFLFFAPQLRTPKRAVDPKKAWTVLMASFVQLRNAHDTLKQSPQDPVARKRFLASEQTCLSLIRDHTDADWGPDAEYAVKVKNEIAELSAAARTECPDLVSTPAPGTRQHAEAGKPGPVPAEEAAAAPPVAPQGVAKPEAPPATKPPDAKTAAEPAGAQPAAPVLPAVVAPSEKEVAAAAAEITAMKPEAPVPTTAPASPPQPEEQPPLTSTSEAAPVQPAALTPSTPPEAPAPVKAEDVSPASEVVVVQPIAPVIPVEPVVALVSEVVPTPVIAAPTQLPGPGQPEQTAPVAEVKPPADASIPEAPAPTIEPPAPVTAIAPGIPTPPATPDLTPAPVPEPAGAAAAVSVENSPPARLDVSGPAGKRLTPFLWLSGVEDAAAFYVSIFRDSRVKGISRYPEVSHAKAWRVTTATVCLDGQDLMLLDAGLMYKPSETFQLQVRCADQAEVDYYWERLLAGGGVESTGGWLKDRFGVAWQIIPEALLELVGDGDPRRAARATAALLEMKKIDIAGLRAAADRA